MRERYWLYHWRGRDDEFPYGTEWVKEEGLPGCWAIFFTPDELVAYMKQRRDVRLTYRGDGYGFTLMITNFGWGQR